MRLALALGAACSGASPPRPTPGAQQRAAEVDIGDVSTEIVDSNGAGTRTLLGGRGLGVHLDIDWTQMRATRVDAPISRAALAGVTVPVEDVLAYTAGGAAVPLVTTALDHPRELDGWRADGTLAWHVELPLPDDAKLVHHAGDVVLVCSVGAYREGYGWPDAVTLALDAATGATRWRVPWTGGRDPCPQRVAGHGDELALLYEDPSHVDVIARADGARRRSIALDRTTMDLADWVGFDGDVFWSFDYTAAHDNPGDHMLGTFPSDPSPASCEYQVWDTRHDRGTWVRTEADLPGWTAGCAVRAMIPLDDGRVQVLLVEGSRLRSLWFDHPP